MEPLILVGGGGHCRSCIEVIEAEGRYAIRGIVDRPERVGSEVSGYRVIASDDDLPSLAASGDAFLVTIGQILSPAARIAIFDRLSSLGARFATVVSPSAQVSRRAKVGRGAIVMHFALVNAGAAVGDNCIINSRALIEHDAAIGDHCHVSTGAIVNGDGRVGAASFIGSGAVVLNQIGVGSGCVVGAGTIVTESLEAPGVYAGSPARPLRRMP